MAVKLMAKQMSADARNSIYAWGIVTAFFAVGWAALHFGLVPSSPRWFLWIMGVLGVLNLAKFTFCLWQRRASNPKNPNLR